MNECKPIFHIKFQNLKFILKNQMRVNNLKNMNEK